MDPVVMKSETARARTNFMVQSATTEIAKWGRGEHGPRVNVGIQIQKTEHGQ